MTTVVIDAQGKILGRLATEVANTLRGKNLPSFRPDRDPDIRVTVINADKFRVSGDKMRQKIYYHFSGYPGGLKKTKMRDILAQRPTDILRLAVKRMLPANRMQAKMMRHLTISGSK